MAVATPTSMSPPSPGRAAARLRPSSLPRAPPPNSPPHELLLPPASFPRILPCSASSPAGSAPPAGPAPPPCPGRFSSPSSPRAPLSRPPRTRLPPSTSDAPLRLLPCGGSTPRANLALFLPPSALHSTSFPAHLSFSRWSPVLPLPAALRSDRPVLTHPTSSSSSAPPAAPCTAPGRAAALLPPSVNACCYCLCLLLTPCSPAPALFPALLLRCPMVLLLLSRCRVLPVRLRPRRFPDAVPTVKPFPMFPDVFPILS